MTLSGTDHNCWPNSVGQVLLLVQNLSFSPTHPAKPNARLYGTLVFYMSQVLYRIILNFPSNSNFFGHIYLFSRVASIHPPKLSIWCTFRHCPWVWVAEMDRRHPSFEQRVYDNDSPCHIINNLSTKIRRLEWWCTYEAVRLLMWR